MVSTQYAYETHQTILAAEEWVHTAVDAMAVVGVVALWVFAIAIVAFVVTLLMALLMSETRRSSSGARNSAASTLSRPSASLRERQQHKGHMAPLTSRLHLQQN